MLRKTNERGSAQEIKFETGIDRHTEKTMQVQRPLNNGGEVDDIKKNR